MGRCADCDLSERRTPAPRERVSDAAAAARLGGQHEREVAAPAEGDRRADDDERRDVEVHGPRCRTAQARQFTFPMGVKSVITSPCGGQTMQGPGLYQISGLAWTGAGRDPARRGLRRRRQDAGRRRHSSDPVLPKALTRFRMAWRWDGSPAVLMSRAVDETGAAQIPHRGVHRGARHTRTAITITRSPVGV